MAFYLNIYIALDKRGYSKPIDESLSLFSKHESSIGFFCLSVSSIFFSDYAFIYFIGSVLELGPRFTSKLGALLSYIIS